MSHSTTTHRARPYLTRPIAISTTLIPNPDTDIDNLRAQNTALFTRMAIRDAPLSRDRFEQFMRCPHRAALVRVDLECRVYRVDEYRWTDVRLRCYVGHVMVFQLAEWSQELS